MSARHRCNWDGSQQGRYPVGPETPAGTARSRRALLASASIIVLAVFGAPDAAKAACVPSPETISGPVTGPVVSNGGAITVTGSGDISGGPDGVDALTCNITTLTNQSGGTISGGAGGSSAVGGAGVSNAATITTLSNAGKISGGTGGFGLQGGAGGAAVLNAGKITTLTNSGAINGGKGGTGFTIDPGPGPIKTLSNSGAIRSGGGGVGAGASFSGVGGGGGAGVSNAGTITSLSNMGAIQRRNRRLRPRSGGPWRLGTVERRTGSNG